jgi:hypothetical protein
MPPPLVIAGPIQPSQEPSVDELLAASRVSFSDWQALVKQAFDVDQRKAVFERYRGARVTWQGYVDQVNRVSPETGSSSSAQFILVMYEDLETLNSRALGRAPALCLFDRNAEQDLNQLRQGERIVVQGTFAAATLHGQLLGTRLYDCKLLQEQ